MERLHPRAGALRLPGSLRAEKILLLHGWGGWAGLRHIGRRLRERDHVTLVVHLPPRHGDALPHLHLQPLGDGIGEELIRHPFNGHLRKHQAAPRSIG